MQAEGGRAGQLRGMRIGGALGRGDGGDVVDEAFRVGAGAPLGQLASPHGDVADEIGADRRTRGRRHRQGAADQGQRPVRCRGGRRLRGGGPGGGRRGSAGAFRDDAAQLFRAGDQQPAVAEGPDVLGDGDAVGAQGRLHGSRGHRQCPGLDGGAEHEGRLEGGVAEQGPGHGRRIGGDGPVGTGTDGVGERDPVGTIGGDVGAHHARGGGRGGDQGGGAAGVDDLQVRRVGGGQAVEGEQQVAPAGGHDARLGQRGIGDAQIRDNGAALLRQTGHVDAADELAVSAGGGGDDRREHDHARAADAGDAYAPAAVAPRAPVRDGEVGVGEIGERSGGGGRRAPGRAVPCAPGDLDRREGRAVAVEAGVVVVAGRLVDAGLAAEGGVHRLDGQAAGLLAAVAAALADALVDDHARRGRRGLAALAGPAVLGGAALVVDEHGDAGFGGQLALDVGEVGAVADFHAIRATAHAARQGPAGAGDVFGGHDDAADALGAQQPHDPRQVLLAHRVLAAGHGDGAVVQQLHGHVRAGGDQGTDGQGSGMEEGAVAEVLHQVPLGDEGPHANPLGALAAHLGRAGDVADAGRIHQKHHRVAADAAAHEAVAGDAGRRVVGAAGAEVRRPVRHGERQAAPGAGGGRDGGGGVVGKPDPAVLQPFPQLGGGVGDGGDGRAVLRAVEAGAHRFGEEVALLVDDGDAAEALREGRELVLLQRPGHAEAKHPHAVGVAEAAQGFLHGEGGRAGADDADLRRSVAAGDAVEAAVAGVPLRPVEALADAGRLQRVQVRAEQVRRGRVPAGGRRGRGGRPGQLHRRVAVGDGGRDPQRGPQARGPRHPCGVDAQLQGLTGIRRDEDGHAQVRQDAFRRRRHRRRLRERVVADDCDGAARRRRAREVGVPQRVDGPVQAGRLAVPVADDAVDALAQRARGRGQLGAGHRGGAELLVDRRLVHDVQIPEQRGAAGQLEVVAAERRSLVAGDEGGGGQAAGPVRQRPVAHHAHQGLDAGQLHRAGLRRVPVRQQRAVGGGGRVVLGRPDAGVRGRGGAAGAAVVRGREHRGHRRSPSSVDSTVRGWAAPWGVAADGRRPPHAGHSCVVPHMYGRGYERP